MENDSTDSGKSTPLEEVSIDRDADFSTLEEGQAAEFGGQDPITSSDSRDAEIARLQSEVAELNDKYLRALADLENYKKRALKEHSDLLKYQGERVLFDLLEVVDNLEFALNYTENASAPQTTNQPEGTSQAAEGSISSASAQKLREGLALIHKMFLNILGKWEVRPESALGRMFDPQRFSAISKVATSDSEPGTVISELKKAYLYKDKLLRPGEVVVAESPSTIEPGSS